MSQESQKIASLRDRLVLIESAQVNEGPLDGVKSAWNAGKNLVKNFKGGLSGDAARTAKGTYAPGASAAGMANRGGKTVAANPIKTAAATGAVGAAAGAGGVAAVTGGAATKPADAAGASEISAKPGSNASALPPEEQKELDALAAELEVHMGRLPELDNLLLQHQALAQGGAATKPAANPELDAIKKNAGVPASANDGNAGEAEAQAAMAAKQPAATPASANDGNAGEAEAQAAMAAKQPAAPSGTTTTTQSNQSVQGTMKMGKPDGPITFNGKVVNPGAPEYAAASAALIKAQGDSQQARQQRFAPKTGAAPVATPGATSSDWSGTK